MFGLIKKKVNKRDKAKLILDIPLISTPQLSTPIGAPNSNGFKAKTTKDIYEIFWKHWNHKSIDYREEYMVLFLTNDLSVLGIGLESIGSKDSCIINHKIIIDKAIFLGSTQIATAHNHPVGSTRPSQTDLKGEKSFQELARSCGIHIIEHTILSPFWKKYYSFLDHNVF